MEYYVTGSAEQIDRYITTDDNNQNVQLEEALSCAFLKYMETHIDKIMFQPTKSSLDDLNGKHFGYHTGLLLEQPLNKSKTACALHEQLKGFYQI